MIATFRGCTVCGSPLTAKQKTTCSRTCRSKRTHQLHPQAGSGNHNFKGWRSKQPSLYTRRFKELNPEKVRAHLLVAAAVRSGVLVRPDACESCFRFCRPDAHHEDYAKPLVVDWLCRKCHAARDKQRAAREAAA